MAALRAQSQFRAVPWFSFDWSGPTGNTFDLEKTLSATVLLCFECTNASLLSMTTGFSLGMCQRKGSNFPRQIIPLRQSTQREPGRSLTLFRANDVPFTV